MSEYVEKNMKNIKQEFKDKGVYYTPDELAETLLSFVDIDYKTAYDPTCGSGNLLMKLDKTIEKYGQELDGEQLEIARRRLENFTGYTGDTLLDDGFSDKKFDLILGNPPFSIKYNAEAINIEKDERFKECGVLPPQSKADWAFMLHILHHLDDNGVAVVIEFPGILYRSQKEAKIREWFVRNNYIDRVVHIPGNTFVDTTISTCILVLKKNKKTTDIIFENREDNVSRIVPFEEVEKNNFNLSVSQYVEAEKKKEEINIDAINKQIADAILHRIDCFFQMRAMEKYFTDNFYIDYFKEECRKILQADDEKEMLRKENCQ